MTTLDSSFTHKKLKVKTYLINCSLHVTNYTLFNKKYLSIFPGRSVVKSLILVLRMWINPNWKISDMSVKLKIKCFGILIWIIHNLMLWKCFKFCHPIERSLTWPDWVVMAWDMWLWCRLVFVYLDKVSESIRWAGLGWRWSSAGEEEIFHIRWILHNTQHSISITLY